MEREGSSRASITRWSAKASAERPAAELRGARGVDLMNQLREDLNLRVHQLGTELFDAAVRRTGEQIVRLRDVADGGNPRARQTAPLTEESAVHRIDDARAVAAAVECGQ